MADRIGPTVDAMEPAPRQAPIDLTTPEPHRYQLPPGDDPVLPLGKHRNRLVRMLKPLFFIYGMENRGLAWHGTDGEEPERTGARRESHPCDRRRKRGSSPPLPPLALIP